MIETSTSVKNIDEKIFKIQAQAPVLKKEADNPYFKSKYAEYPEIQAAIKPIIKEHNLLVMFLPVSDNKLTLYVKDIISNEFYKVTADLNMGSVSPQAQGSAITYLKRYMLTAFFDLQIEDASDDDGNAGSGKTTNAQAPAAANQQQKPADQKPPAAPPAPPANLNWLNPNTKDWFNQKWLIFNKGKNIEDIRKKYKVNKTNGLTLVKIEEVKPGSVYWQLSVEYLAKEGSKIENITNMFTFTETDLQDLQIDATDYKPATDEPKNTATNETTT